MHLHALEMDVLEIVEALDHQELDPNLGTHGDPKFTTVQSTEYTVVIYFLLGGLIFLESLLGMDSPTGICWNHGIS